MSPKLSSLQTDNIRPVVLGASGRLGHMLRGIWGDGGAIWQSRSTARWAQLASDRETLLRLMQDAPAVICLWGVVPGRGGVMEDNISLARLALDLAKETQAGPVLLASSAAVYGRSTGLLTEDRAAPISEYGKAKLAMEEMAACHPHPSCSMRICNVAGADAILSDWRAGMTVEHDPSAGTPSRSYIGPHALAAVLRALCGRSDLPKVLNVAQPGAVAMGDLLDAAGLSWTKRAASPNVIWDVTLDTARLAQFCPFVAEKTSAAAIVADWRKLEPQ